jgi:hypothetical protein
MALLVENKEASVTTYEDAETLAVAGRVELSGL